MEWKRNPAPNRTRTPTQNTCWCLIKRPETSCPRTLADWVPPYFSGGKSVLLLPLGEAPDASAGTKRGVRALLHPQFLNAARQLEVHVSLWHAEGIEAFDKQITRHFRRLWGSFVQDNRRYHCTAVTRRLSTGEGQCRPAGRRTNHYGYGTSAPTTSGVSPAEPSPGPHSRDCVASLWRNGGMIECSHFGRTLTASTFPFRGPAPLASASAYRSTLWRSAATSSQTHKGSCIIGARTSLSRLLRTCSVRPRSWPQDGAVERFWPACVQRAFADVAGLTKQFGGWTG